MMHRSAACVVALVALTSLGCGTRVQESGAAARSAGSGNQVATDQGTATQSVPAATGTLDSSAPADTRATAATGTTSAAGRSAAGDTKTQTTSRPAAGGAGAPSGPSEPRGSVGSGTKPTPGSESPSPGRAAAPVPAPPPVPSGSSPVNIASVGTYSGPAASTLKPILDGGQLWVKYINAKGGLNGHPVKLAVYDDGGDPARHRAQVQDAVENRKVVAFFVNAEALTGQGSNDYIKSHRVPVVGVDGGWDFPYKNPMYFLQHPSGASQYLTFVLSTAEWLVPAKKTKLAILDCQEAQGCTDTDRIWKERAKALGLDLVYSGRASVAQPDFTAECLAARNAGADAFFILMDGNSVTRVANSCSRQGYKPQYALAGSVVLDRHQTDPNLEGAVSSSTVMPYFRTGTPASDEFQQAFKSFGTGLQYGVGMVLGWASGKLLEKAGAQLTEPPTSESLLRGLWSVKNDTLGGITYPVTFEEGKPPSRQSCWFRIQVKNKAWTSPDFNQSCGR